MEIYICEGCGKQHTKIKNPKGLTCLGSYCVKTILEVDEGVDND